MKCARKLMLNRQVTKAREWSGIEKSLASRRRGNGNKYDV